MNRASHFICACLAAAMLAGGAGVALAQTGLPSGSGSNELVRRQLNLALTNIGRARCENNQPCAPASAAELANPPITIAEADSIMRRGVVSGAAEKCGLDWQGRNFGPMMAYWRRSQKKTERQMALIALLHGISQSQAGIVLAQDPCTEQVKRNLDAKLSFQP